jgi:hypothetical protein|tara:strand:- start:1178 stop:1477 length:300 start_codon:yes stop_codon:yes gene_type:complete
MARIFDTDALAGITRYWHVKDNGEFVIETVQQADAILDSNKRQFNSASNKHGDMDKVASIPLSVYYDLKRQGIADDPKALKKWLNDPDNRAFRTRGGRL